MINELIEFLHFSFIEYPIFGLSTLFFIGIFYYCCYMIYKDCIDDNYLEKAMWDQDEEPEINEGLGLTEKIEIKEGNPLLIGHNLKNLSKYAEEFPEQWKTICERVERDKNKNE